MIKVVPLSFMMNNKIYREKANISYNKFYKTILQGMTFETPQPSPQDFIPIYRPIIEKRDKIIPIHISSKPSGTVNCANSTRENNSLLKLYFILHLIEGRINFFKKASQEMAQKENLPKS